MSLIWITHSTGLFNGRRSHCILCCTWFKLTTYRPNVNCGQTLGYWIYVSYEVLTTEKLNRWTLGAVSKSTFHRNTGVILTNIRLCVLTITYSGRTRWQVLCFHRVILSNKFQHFRATNLFLSCRSISLTFGKTWFTLHPEDSFYIILFRSIVAKTMKCALLNKWLLAIQVDEISRQGLFSAKGVKFNTI